MSRARAVFFDRDGTLMEEVHYCGDPAGVQVFPEVPEALRKLKEAGFRTFVITNQSGIARGLITEAQYHAVQEELLRQIGAGAIDATYFCADPPAAPSTRRKPEPGMVLEAAAAYDIDLARSYFIGDKSADIECGQRAGTRTILVLTGYGMEQDCRPDFTAHDIAEAVRIVLRTSDGPASGRARPRTSGSRPRRHRRQL
jgi:D-glycero-D-manno-heptose 1,7-bisphosphate phosphatase